MKVIIVGGVAGGATAAARLRRLDETAEIVVFERSGYVSYANCGLPYYIGGVITDKEELTLQTPESFWRRFRVDMRVRHEVTAIHPAEKTVDVRNLATGETFTESYDKLVLSPGARPTQPALPGVGIDRLFTLRTVEDTLKIREFIEQHHPRSAVLAGGGFIGVELMENLRELGIDVTVVQRPRQLLNPLDADMAAFLHAKLRQKGVRLHLGCTVEGFAANGDRVNVLLKNEAPLTADMVVLAIGVTPERTRRPSPPTWWCPWRPTGCGKSRAASCDRMETSGDAGEALRHRAGLWPPANGDRRQTCAAETAGIPAPLTALPPPA